MLSSLGGRSWSGRRGRSRRGGNGRAAASCGAGGAGEGEGEGAAFCAVGAGADEGADSWTTGAGVTVAGLGETGGVTFVGLLAVQKTAAIAMRTTPASKAHNHRDMAPPLCRSELSLMMGDPHPSVESLGERSRGATLAVVNLSWRAHDAPSRVFRRAAPAVKTQLARSHGVRRLLVSSRRAAGGLVFWQFWQWIPPAFSQSGARRRVSRVHP